MNDTYTCTFVFRYYLTGRANSSRGGGGGWSVGGGDIPLI